MYIMLHFSAEFTLIIFLSDFNPCTGFLGFFFLGIPWLIFIPILLGCQMQTAIELNNSPLPSSYCNDKLCEKNSLSRNYATHYTCFKL